jgi:type I restriction enzyme S subunit
VLKFVDFDFALGADGVKVLKPRPGFNARFLFHFLRTIRLPENVGYSRHFKFLKGCSVPKPTPDEQQRIATILDKADSLRQKRQEAIRLVDKFLRAVFVDMFGDPKTNPKSFAKGTIRDLVSAANYGTSEKASEERGQYPILRMNNITYDGGWDFSSLKYVDLDEASAHKYLAQKGDLLFNRTNSKELVGKTAVYMRDEPMAIAGYLVRVRMNERGNSHYVSGYLNSAHGKRTLEARAKSIVGMANINAQEMQDIPLLLPPIELQNKYASIVGAMQERLRKYHAFSREAEALHAALSESFFSQADERVTEPC